MRHITQLEPTKLQQEDKYQIRKRADALLEKWQKLVHNVKEEQQGQDIANLSANVPIEAVNGSIASKPSDASVKNNKPKSGSEKVAVFAEVPATKPASQSNVNAKVSDLHANGGETTEQVSNVTAETPVLASTLVPMDVPSADDEQAMDMTDD